MDRKIRLAVALDVMMAQSNFAFDGCFENASEHLSSTDLNLARLADVDGYNSPQFGSSHLVICYFALRVDSFAGVERIDKNCYARAKSEGILCNAADEQQVVRELVYVGFQGFQELDD